MPRLRAGIFPSADRISAEVRRYDRRGESEARLEDALDGKLAKHGLVRKREARGRPKYRLND